MNLNQQLSRYGLYLLLAVMIFGVASWGIFGRSPERIAQVSPLPSGEPPVAYGASLSEWEEATQANAAQTASTNGRSSEETQVVSPLAVPAPVSPLSTPAVTKADIGVPFTFENVVYREILWDGLIPADFTAESIMAKYQDEIAVLEDGSPEASELYLRMQEEFSNAPVNEVINQVEVRLPGFIAPLDYTDDLITEFLLVPYFGACIHVPPPPANQTVLVKTAEGQGIKVEDSYNPIWVMGKILTDSTTTELAAAGYNIEEAFIEPYIYTQ